ncbi:phosphoribosyltransferase family protein [Kitasatospora sp. NBC_01287]|uniref:ComF family protein n=1 Tax=Kitasatospora sp. NBC_01287 TaxID=2903573 RepID=UPI00225A6E85|nr:phosphoribosyltransferase family protein [Kitasatospora sp. NBC_01287]MCX4748712.1 phosphoribosyltransferase family protein [Kitasatospora sp. NBC_01287]
MSTLLLDLLLPTACAGCGEPGGQLCLDCRALLAGLRGAPAGPEPAPAGLPPLHSCAGYRDPLRGLLLTHKERGALRLAGPLGMVLAAAVRSALAAERPPGDAGARPLLLVPVPSARRAVRARGHDATRRLARCAAHRLNRSGLPCRVAPVLRQRRAVVDQAGLGAEQRRANLHQALAVPPLFQTALSGRQLVLVDDLVTTGASLAEAARALRAAGAPALAAATVAATARHERAPDHAAPRAVHHRGHRAPRAQPG